MTSSELVGRLMKADRCSAEAARKRVSRVKRPARILYGLVLPKNARFLYHDEHFNHDVYFANLSHALKETGSAYGRALYGLELQGGSMPQHQFPIASGLPSRRTLKHVQHKVVEKILLKIGLIQIHESADGPLVALRASGVLTKRRRAERAVEDILLGIIKTHLGRINLTSYEAAKTRAASMPMVGPFVWDFTAPTYTAGLFHYGPKGKQPGFVVGDIVLGREILLESLTPFFSKCSALDAQNRAAKLTPFFAADHFEKNALAALRKRGFLVLTPENLYGKEFAHLLVELTGKIENATQALTKDPNSLVKILSDLMKIEGASLNLRGVVLEFMVGQTALNEGYSFDIRQRIHDNQGNEAEIDVFAKKKAEWVCVECKAPLPGNLVSQGEIERWVQDVLPRIKEWIKSNEEAPQKISFEFCSATDFHPDAHALIDKIQREHKKQPVTFINGAEVVRRLRENNQTAFVKIFNEQFGRAVFRS
jgi:hypothetical protein